MWRMEGGELSLKMSGPYLIRFRSEGVLQITRKMIYYWIDYWVRKVFVVKMGKIRDKTVPSFQPELGPFPLDWQTTIHWNVSPIIFQQPWYMWFSWKMVVTTFQCMIVLQSRRRCSYLCWNILESGSQFAAYNYFA